MKKTTKKKRFFLFMVSFVGFITCQLVPSKISINPLVEKIIGTVGYLSAGCCIAIILLTWRNQLKSEKTNHGRYLVNSIYVGVLIGPGVFWFLEGLKTFTEIPMWTSIAFRISCVVCSANTIFSLINFFHKESKIKKRIIS